MDPNMMTIVIGAAIGGVSFFLGWFLNARSGHNKLSSAEERAKKILEDAEKEANTLKREKLVEAKDEWFKRNWLVMNYEVPPERTTLWHNALDPEQNYGLLAAAPGREGPVIRVDGRGGSKRLDGALDNFRVANSNVFINLPAAKTDNGRGEDNW